MIFLTWWSAIKKQFSKFVLDASEQYYEQSVIYNLM